MLDTPLYFILYDIMADKIIVRPLSSNQCEVLVHGDRDGYRMLNTNTAACTSTHFFPGVNIVNDAYLLEYDLKVNV